MVVAQRRCRFVTKVAAALLVCLVKAPLVYAQGAPDVSDSSPDYVLPKSGLEFSTGDTWKDNGRLFHLYGVQACLRNTEFRNEAGRPQDCGEASLSYLAALIRDTNPTCRVLGEVSPNSGSYVVCQARVGNSALDLGTMLITQGFAFAALARAGDAWMPVFAPYAVAEDIARASRRGLWSGSFSHPASILERGSR